MLNTTVIHVNMEFFICSKCLNKNNYTNLDNMTRKLGNLRKHDIVYKFRYIQK